MSLSIIYFLVFAIFSVAAQSASSDVYRRVDGAFRSKNIDTLKEIITSTRDSRDYPSIESYILKSAREMLLENDLDFAAAATLALIDANLDNFEAVTFYTSVEKAIATREANRKAEEERAQLEHLKKQTVVEKAKDDIKKEYKTITNSSSGETVYLDQDYNMRYAQVSWGAYLGVGDIGVVFDKDNLSPKYGLSLAGNFLYRADDFSLGGEAMGDVLLMAFAGYQNLITSAKTSLMGSVNKLNRNLFFRLGYTGWFTTIDIDNNASTVLPESFMGPTIGVGLRDIKLANILVDAYLDYNFGHLFYDNVYTTLELGVNFLLIVADLNKVDVALSFGLHDDLTITEDGGHNQTKIVISIGVGNND